MPTLPPFAEFLRGAREASGLTQAALAGECGLTGSYISLLESGRKPAPSDRVVKRLAEALSLSPEAALEVAHFDRAPEDLRRALDRLRKEAARQREMGERAAEAIVPLSLWNFVPGSLSERFRFGSAANLEPEVVAALDQLMEAARRAPDLPALRVESRRVLAGLSPVMRRKIIEAVPSLVDGAGEGGVRRLLPAPEPGLPPDILPGDILVVDPSLVPSPGDVVVAEESGRPILRRFAKGDGPAAGVVVEVRRKLK